ncbi:MAG: septal ring lytic transglycosylase RlpA family protein [Coxiellaceae bacterium]|jgi:rare lipoprotein A|nr:septal ring lytic transglycosylase RlpA family protein [Coxiellaceae bacterium]
MELLPHEKICRPNTKGETRSDLITVLVYIFCLTQLSGCGVFNYSKHAEYDGPPVIDVDVTRLKDAVPRIEPLHPYGTKDYVLGGRHYSVLKNSKGYVKQGYASWYGSKFHGRKTSTQEYYNLYAMTAASPELPLPSYVQVTNLQNGKKVIVKVNDRGPFYANRIIDLSYVAAKKLDFVKDGVALVKVVAIDPKTWNKNANSMTKEQYTKDQYIKKQMFLQIGVFSKLDNARQMLNKVDALVENSTKIKHKHNLYHVYIGPFADLNRCNQIKSILKLRGIDHITIVEN